MSLRNEASLPAEDQRVLCGCVEQHKRRQFDEAFRAHCQGTVRSFQDQSPRACC